MPIQEDINTAFEKLINPVLKNVTGFDWKTTYCEQTAYLSITTTDDQVHTYITSVMEVIHRLPKQWKWDSSKPKVQAITSGEESATGNQKKDKEKVRERVKVSPRLHLSRIKGVTKKPLAADPVDVQRLHGKPQFVPKAAGVPTGPPPQASSSTTPTNQSSAVPKPVVSMIRVNRNDLEPEAEPGARHRVARWRATEGATISNHPIDPVPEPKGGCYSSFWRTPWRKDTLWSKPDFTVVCL